MPKTPSPAVSSLRRLQNAFLSQISVDHQLLEIFCLLPEIHCFVKNRSGETIFVSPQWALHHGFGSAEEMLFMTDQDLTPGRLAADYLEDDAAVYRTGLPRIGILETCIDEVGLPDWHITHKFPLRNARGAVIGILGFSRPCRGEAPEDSPDARLSPATRMLRQQLGTFPALQTLATACHLSVRHLQRRFQETFGISPRTYWMKCRIRAACEALRVAQTSIAQIAHSLGFCDQSSFTDQFRRHTGQTPGQFLARKLRRAEPSGKPASPSRRKSQL
ncbi:MAG: hypothetical protein RLZZ244_1785 [Verrucomicrobiota bacterium]|jgi:AraC-like DNA-binding protein